MYGDTKGVPITEQLPNAAHTRKGKVRAAMAEEMVAIFTKDEGKRESKRERVPAAE